MVLIVAWSVAGAVRHVVFLFIVAGLIALLLNPIVRGLGTGVDPARICGGARLSLLRRSRRRSRASRSRPSSSTRPNRLRIGSTTTLRRSTDGLPITDAERDVDRLQAVAERPPPRADQGPQARRSTSSNNAGSKDVSRYASKAISWAEGAAVSFVTLLFSTVLIIVVSIYMLLDMQRLARVIDRRFPPRPGSRAADVARRALARRVREGAVAPLR